MRSLALLGLVALATGAGQRPASAAPQPSGFEVALHGGDTALAGRPALVDVSLGKGHVVLFGVRPFWRNETSGSHFLAFNAILNWSHLNAGR